MFVDNATLVCQSDFLAAEAAGLELRNAHLALVSESEGSHVAEDDAWVACCVRKAVDAGSADCRHPPVGVDRVAEDFSRWLDRAAARMILDCRFRPCQSCEGQDVVAGRILVDANLRPERAVHVE